MIDGHYPQTDRGQGLFGIEAEPNNVSSRLENPADLRTSSRFHQVK